MRRPLRVVVPSYDFKFVRGIEHALRRDHAVVRRDPWFGLDQHDPGRTRERLAWADVILAEWCLGNAVSASQQVGGQQRLLVRLHRFELDRAHPREVDAHAVEAFVFVGPHIRDEAVERFSWPRERCVWIPNGVDPDRFSTHKQPGAERTLGLIGWHRQLKRLDRALDLLERLRADDDRWRLRCKGQHPWELAWLRGRRDERQWLERVLERIAASAELSRAVSFDAHGPVEGWLERIGWILSPSDVESFHLATAEGMAAGCVPVIWQRAGAAQLFPSRWVHADTTAAHHAVAGTSDTARRAAGAQARDFVAERYDERQVTAAWRHRVLAGR